MCNLVHAERGVLLRLKTCHEGHLNSGSVDLRSTASVYNLCFWINPHSSFIYLPAESLTLVELNYNGEYTLYSEDCKEEDNLVKKLVKALGLNEDLSEFLRKGRKDPLLGPFLEVYSGLRTRSTSLWWALVTGTCQQNASFKQGWGMIHRIVSTYNMTVELEDGRRVLRPPTPHEVLENLDKLVASGLGYRARTIKNVAESLIKGEIHEEAFKGSSPREIEKELTRIKGVGPYTARFAMAFSLRIYELPPVDRWLRKVASVTYAVDEKFVEEFWAERWNRWSALATIHATVALDAEPLQRALERVRNRELLPKSNLTPTPLNMHGFCA